MAHLDVFRQNAGGAFHMTTLTGLLLDQPHTPLRLGQMGLFNQQGMRTLGASIERQGNTLRLVPVTPRNTPGVLLTPGSRDMVSIPTARIQEESQITADEVQNIRSLGSETELMTIQEEVNRRNTTLSNDIEVTIEYHRIGALKGQVYDANGGVLLDLFQTFNVTAQTEVAFDLGNLANGALRNKCNDVIRLIEDELGALPYSSIHAMCSSQFFDAFTANAEFRAFHIGWTQAIQLAGRTARRSVDFGGITWEEYRGKVGNTKYVADDKAHIFPLGVPGLFETRYAPAEFMETVNTVGLPRYVSIIPDETGRNRHVTTVVQTQVVNMCTRPRVLIPARRGA